MLLFYVRHGYPTYDPDCLTPLGRRQADAVAKRLALYGIDRVFASSSTRAIQTAQPTCELMRIGMTVLDWCHESRAWEEYAYPDPADQAVRWDFTTPSIRKLYASPEMRALGIVAALRAITRSMRARFSASRVSAFSLSSASASSALEREG